MVEMQPDGMEQPMPMGPDMQAMYGQDPNAAGQYMDGQEEEGKSTWPQCTTSCDYLMHSNWS